MTEYLVIMPNSWGKGATIGEADKLARKHGGHGRKKIKRVVLSYDPTATTEVSMDDLGRLRWNGVEPTMVEKP